MLLFLQNSGHHLRVFMMYFFIRQSYLATRRMLSHLFMLNQAETLVWTGLAATILPANLAAHAVKTAGKQGYYSDHG
jgi:hypothetical protein